MPIQHYTLRASGPYEARTKVQGPFDGAGGLVLLSGRGKGAQADAAHTVPFVQAQKVLQAVEDGSGALEQVSRIGGVTKGA
jgi:hypothetical protein